MKLESVIYQKPHYVIDQAPSRFIYLHEILGFIHIHMFCEGQIHLGFLVAQISSSQECYVGHNYFSSAYSSALSPWESCQAYNI